MEPFIAQIIIFAGNFAPRGWAFCNGQLLPISQYTALFSLVGTIYGGDGRTTFALPDLRGRAPIHTGTGPGLSPRSLGTTVGSEMNHMTVSQMPPHTHPATSTVAIKLEISTDVGEDSNPNGQYLAAGSNIYIDSPTANTSLAGASATVDTTVSNAGSGTPIDNMQPSLSVNYIIALQGTFPSRS